METETQPSTQPKTFPKTFPKMDPEWKVKWLAALRSGDFKQTTRRLYGGEEDAYCCMGVLCEVIEPGRNWEGYSYPPVDIKQKCNFNGGARIDGEPDRTLQSLLGKMNDDRRMTFLQIADWIEANL